MAAAFLPEEKNQEFLDALGAFAADQGGCVGKMGDSLMPLAVLHFVLRKILFMFRSFFLGFLSNSLLQYTALLLGGAFVYFFLSKPS